MNPREKHQRRIRRHQRVRAKIFGSASRPRLSVFKSNHYLYFQLIDDQKGVTLASASTREHETSQALAKALAGDAQKLNIRETVFDRGGYPYHGKIKEVVEKFRAQGLKI